MKTYYLKDFNEESFIDINKWLDELGDNEGQIYINSGGGSIWVENAILERIENLKIKLIGLFLGSCAFDLFYNFKGEKELSKGCDGIVHIDANETAIFTHNGQIKIRGDEVDKARVAIRGDFNYDFLTEEEKNKFYNGEDIYLSYDRLKEIFKK